MPNRTNLWYVEVPANDEIKNMCVEFFTKWKFPPRLIENVLDTEGKAHSLWQMPYSIMLMARREFLQAGFVSQIFKRNLGDTRVTLFSISVSREKRSF